MLSRRNVCRVYVVFSCRTECKADEMKRRRRIQPRRYNIEDGKKKEVDDVRDIKTDQNINTLRYETG